MDDCLFPKFEYTIRNKNKNAQNYVDFMLCRTQSIFEYSSQQDSRTETLDFQRLEQYLQIYGKCAIIENKGKLYFVKGEYTGLLNPNFRPKKFIMYNPYLTGKTEFDINTDCIIIRNDSYDKGLLPLFQRYAYLLSETDVTMRTALINMRVMLILSANDNSTKQAADEFICKIKNGDICAILEKNSLLDEQNSLRSLPTTGIANNYLSQLIELSQYLKATCYNDIGIQANYNMKRESINSNEAQLNNEALLPFIDDMLKNRKEALRNIKKMFGVTINVSLSSAWSDDVVTEKGGEKNNADITEN